MSGRAAQIPGRVPLVTAARDYLTEHLTGNPDDAMRQIVGALRTVATSTGPVIFQ